MVLSWKVYVLEIKHKAGKNPCVSIFLLTKTKMLKFFKYLFALPQKTMASQLVI